jgi:isopenicillin-N epimerase
MTETHSRGPTYNWRDQWILRPGVTYLNHGSFGPSPRPVIAARQEWIERLESEPMDFFVRTMERHLEHARQRLGELVGTSGENLLFVDNATFGMNIVAASVPLAAGDEVLATNHEYGAVLRIWRERCQKAGAKLVVQKLPASFVDADEVVSALFAGASARTKLIVVSHITSPTALVLPVVEICRRAKERNLPVCIDGPHALAAVPLELDRLECDFYCASCHKWLSAPFGSGFLYVHPRWKQSVQPVVVSWGNSLSGRPRSWQDEFVWSGTRDPSPFLAVPAAIDFLAGLSPNSVASEAIDIFRGMSHRLVDVARQKITALTGLAPIGAPPREWYGTMITLPLPDRVGEVPHGHMHPFQEALWERFQIEAPVVNWNGRRHIRISCHLYNGVDDIDRMVAALGEILAEPGA